MLAALASLDAAGVASIILKALVYASSLLAAGSALFVVAFPMAPTAAARTARHLAVWSALVAILLSIARLGSRAVFLGGGDPGMALDPVLLGVVIDSPLGTSTIVRVAGLVLVLGVVLPGRAGVWSVVVGAIATAMSFALVGHALGEPRVLLAVLLTVHVLAVAFWVGALAPLRRAALALPETQTGHLANAFGRKAIWSVAMLVAAGGALILLLTGAPLPSADAGYGQGLILKLIAVAALIGLAALNKLRLTPALVRGDRAAARSLARSIEIEIALILVVLLATATVTTLTSPTG